MKKLIELPDDKIEELKIIAIKANMSFKAWIEHVIVFQLK